MLVLYRRTNETVIIDDVIEVTVLEIRQDKVRLGFKAPDSITIHRREVWLLIEAKKKGSSPESVGK